MVKFIGMVGQPRRNSAKMVSWSRVSEHLVNIIGMSDQLKWNNHLAVLVYRIVFLHLMVYQLELIFYGSIKFKFYFD